MVFRLSDYVTNIMSEIIKLHSDLMFYIIIIVCLVIWMLVEIVLTYGINQYVWGLSSIIEMFLNRRLVTVTRKITHGKVIEIVWTLFPALVLVCIAIPSLTLLYRMDDVYNPLITIKVVGNQWYWSYEYIGDEEQILQFDSYMLTEDALVIGDYRLLEVDREAWLPVNIPVRVLVTSSDVLHCWALPMAGIKVDAVPGRLNQVMLLLEREGTFYGQCSEICGVNHGFMPIVVNSSSYILFNKWLDIVIK